MSRGHQLGRDSGVVDKLQAEMVDDLDIQRVQAFGERVLAEVERVWIGPRRVLEWTVVALLARGHLLLEDVPGVGKTLLARSLSEALGCGFKRLQLTPDVLPADVTGFSVYDQQRGEFRFRPGPIFTHVLLADEINRTVPRTQSSLLEAMQEGVVSVDGETRALPQPFWVLATQNPIDSEGTFPLPEAQRDRFLMKIPLGYPSRENEEEILIRYGRTPVESIGASAPGVERRSGEGGVASGAGSPLRVTAVSHPEEICELQALCRQVAVSPPVRDYLLNVVAATREHADVALGASPRASLALLWAAQARAAVRGRAFVVPDDVKALATVVLAHRLVLKPQAALRGVKTETVADEIRRQISIPVESLNGAGETDAG